MILLIKEQLILNQEIFIYGCFITIFLVLIIKGQFLTRNFEIIKEREKMLLQQSIIFEEASFIINIEKSESYFDFLYSVDNHYEE